jgi:hypothetical protein
VRMEGWKSLASSVGVAFFVALAVTFADVDAVAGAFSGAVAGAGSVAFAFARAVVFAVAGSAVVAGAVAVAYAVANAGAFAFTVAVASGVAGAVAVVAFAGAGAFAFALVVTVAGTVAGAVAFVFAVTFGVAGAGPLAFAGAGAIAFAAAVAGAVMVLSVTAIKQRWQGLFLALFLPAMIVACLGAAELLSVKAGPLLLFLGLLTLLNAPFDWASLGLTRALLRRGLELGGWWPSFSCHCRCSSRRAHYRASRADHGGGRASF